MMATSVNTSQPLPGVAGGLALFHGQAGVEQQHAVLRPAHQTAARAGGKAGKGWPRSRCSSLKILRSEGGKRNPWRYRKRQPLGLAAPVVGVLPQDDHAHGGRIGQRQRPQGLRGKDDRTRRLALLQKCLQCLPRSTGKKLGHQGAATQGRRAIARGRRAGVDRQRKGVTGKKS